MARQGQDVHRSQLLHRGSRPGRHAPPRRHQGPLRPLPRGQGNPSLVDLWGKLSPLPPFPLPPPQPAKLVFSENTLAKYSRSMAVETVDRQTEKTAVMCGHACTTKQAMSTALTEGVHGVIVTRTKVEGMWCWVNNRRTPPLFPPPSRHLPASSRLPIPLMSIQHQ